MASKKVARESRTPKRRSGKGIKRAAERAGVCLLDRAVVERLDWLLRSAAESAIAAAPREFPPMIGRVGAQAAVDAYRTIREVREAFAKALEGGAQ